MSPCAHSASGMHLAGGTAQLEHGQVSGSMGTRFPVGFLLPPVSGRGGNISQPRSAPASLCPAFQHQDVLLRRALTSTVTASFASHSPLFHPPLSSTPLLSSTASPKAQGQILKPDTLSPFHHLPVNPLWAQTPSFQAQSPPQGEFEGSAIWDDGWIFLEGFHRRINQRDFYPPAPWHLGISAKCDPSPAGCAGLGTQAKATPNSCRKHFSPFPWPDFSLCTQVAPYVPVPPALPGAGVSFS